ncbi:MAG: ACT domain-containing protein [Oscillospiraceae bacterium]|nr:ACT domain-containing protein [Oscillospiraceae bacterium]
MLIRQISIFIENRPGRLAAVTQLLGDAGIDIRSLCLADTRDFGILRLIVNQPDRAIGVLKDADCTITVTNVVGVKIPDRPNGLAEILQILNRADVNVEYMYAFVGQTGDCANVIFRVDNEEKCVQVLQENDVAVLTNQEVSGDC